MMGVKAAPIELSQGQRPAGTVIAVGKGMNGGSNDR